jgi:ParB/RepB/Spo0J family partition protein
MNHLASTPPSAISLEQLQPSRFQYRRTVSEAGLAELAQSIKAQGVLQPLLARPLTSQVPDQLFEIVFGHRRFAAAQLAGLERVPVIVAALSDEEARLAQIAENLEREDVHPIEEGEAFAALIAEHGHTREQIAQAYGKSLSYVTGRLKLLQACPQVRKACLAGEIGSEVALLVARLRTPELQDKALAAIKSQYLDLGEGGTRSFRQIRELLAEKFTLELKGALFDPDDAALVPEAGTCAACPKRSGNAPEFEDLAAERRSRHGNRIGGSADLCTDPDCWEAKTKRHHRNRAEALEREGKTVISGGKARAAISAHGEIKPEYVPMKDVRAALKAVAKAGSTVKHVAPLTILDPRTNKTHEVVRAADLQAAGVKPAKPAAAAKPSYRENEEKWKREREQREARQAATREHNQRVLQAVHAATEGLVPGITELRLIARHMADMLAMSDDELHLMPLWACKDRKALMALPDTLDAAGLTRFILAAAVSENMDGDYEGRNQAKALHAYATHLGIDVKALAQTPAKPAPTPAKAAPAAKKKAGKAKAAQQVRYRDPATGQTWSGRGLQPNWLKAAIADGATLASFDTAQGALALEEATA